ncbi:MAG: MFS transporter [Chloroflexi bacterium]|nr:MFS transporter [Chloroflexota bacterium]
MVSPRPPDVDVLTHADAGAAAATDRRRRRSPIFYGWVLTGVGFVVNLLNGALLFHAFGTYVVLLRDEFGWSRTSFSLAFSLMRVESGLLGPLEGWAIDRFGPRKVMTLGNVVFGAGLILLATINSLLEFYLVLLVLALGGALGAFFPISVSIVNWFDRKRAMALATLSLGFSAGGLIQPGIVAGLEGLGWRMFSVLAGVVVLLVAVPLAQLVRHRPEDYGYLPDGATEEQAEQDRAAGRQEVSFTASQAMRTSAFWMLSLGQSASVLVFGAVSVHFVAHVTESIGLTLGEAASAITLMTAMMVIGQIAIGGYIGDRVSKRGLIVVSMLGHTVALMILAFAATMPMVLVFGVVNGLAMGTRGPLSQALRAEYFGRAHFGTIMGFSSLVMMIGIVGGPMIAGLSYDFLGAYRPAFILLAVLSGLGSIFFWLARPPVLPRQAADAQAPAVAAGC